MSRPGRAGAPPTLWRSLLRRCLHPDDRRFALADLDEGFERRAADSRAAGRRWYRLQVLRSLGPAVAGRWSRRPRNLASGLLEDTRYAARGLARTPVVTLVAVVSLAVGMAAVTSVFNIANALLVRPLSRTLQEPERLVAIFTSDNGSNLYGRFSFPDYEDLASSARTFESIAAVRFGAVRIGDPGTGRRVFAEIVTGNYFDVLRVPMQVGRAFRPDESRVGAAERVVVISDRLWRDELGGRPDVVGETLRIDGDPFTVVGVAPADLASMTLAIRADAWVPIGIPGGVFLSDERELAARSERDYTTLGRLAPGVDMATADAEVKTVARRLAAAHGQLWLDNQDRERTMTVMPASAARVPPDAFPALASGVGIVIIATSLLLAVACANVAGVLLARATRRAREIAVRLALGAHRGRVARLVLAESLLLGLVAAVPALLLTRWWTRSFDSIPLPIGDLELPLDLSMDWRVPAFALGLGVLVSLAFGIGPALYAGRTSVETALKAGGRSTGGRSTQRLRKLLVCLQVAAALMFVVGAGVAIRSFGELAEMPWGVDPERVAVMSFTIPDDVERDALPGRYRELHERVASAGPVEAAALSTTVEGGQFVFGTASRVRPADAPESAVPVLAAFNTVSAGYMELLDVRIERGRAIGLEDDERAAPVTVINATLASALWGDDDPLGRRLVFDEIEHEVVGVAADGRYVDVDQGDQSYLWLSLPQRPSHRVMILAHGRSSVADGLPALRSVADTGVQDIIAIAPQPYLQLVTFQFGYLRVLGRLLGWAGGFGLLLATLGLYGIVAWAVERRRHDLAVHQAVGASPGEVMRMVLGEGVRLALLGLAVGLALVVPATAVLRSEIGNVSSVDVPSTVIGALAVLAVAVLAAALPARRATRIHPARALGSE